MVAIIVKGTVVSSDHQISEGEVKQAGMYVECRRKKLKISG